MGQHAE
jgi:hypothetical protein